MSLLHKVDARTKFKAVVYMKTIIFLIVLRFNAGNRGETIYFGVDV